MRKRIARLLTLALLVSTMSLSAQDQESQVRRFEFSSNHMGTAFRIILYAADSTGASEAARDAFRRISELDSIMSDYRPDSELNRLSATAGSGAFIKVSDDLWQVLRQANRISRKTGGAFDASIGPLVKLWRRSFRQRRLPDPAKLKKARLLSGYKKVRLDKKNRKVRLEKKGMALDLGGIAKGYAADQALKTLVQRGIRRALVDAGGDIVAGDAPPGKEGWTIEILLNETETAKTLLLVNQAAATSGDLYQHVGIDGIRYSHIVDPRTGYGVTGQATSTVIANTGTVADALASALSVMGPSGVAKIKGPGKPALLYAQKTERTVSFFYNRRMRKLISF